MSKKSFIFLILGITLIGVLVYFLGEYGLGIGALLVGSVAGKNLQKKQKQLEKDLDQIEKQKILLEKKGVKDLNSQDEVNYWKKQ